MSARSKSTNNASTTAQGDAFRDHVCRMLAAAGFQEVKAEVRSDFKKVDGSSEWTRHTIDGRLRILIEAKYYSGTLDKDQCEKFVSEYGALVRSSTSVRAWLISSGPISPDGRALIECKGNEGLRCYTYSEFQRHLLQLDGYLMELCGRYESSGIGKFYIRPHVENHGDLEAVVRSWIEESGAPPLAVLGSYGKGKSTFAHQLAAVMAHESLKDPTKRVPILVPLGDLVDEQAIDGLLGKVLASQYRVDNYHYHLFKELNSAGLFLIIFDGLDEMKHGMTPTMFEQNMSKLLQLDTGNSRVLVLGRDTAFQDDPEFRAVVLGRQTTAAGTEVPTRGRRALRYVTLCGFTLPEGRNFVERYFPFKAREYAQMHNRPLDDAWITARQGELLSGAFDSLLERPVHAQMLCEIATDPSNILDEISTFDLYDLFIHYLIDREVKKAGRDPKFTIHVRRSFNAALAWWLWENGESTTTTFANIPQQLCINATSKINHDYDDFGLKRELTTGCLVEKGGNTIYFGHRSIQEFLVAEYLYNTNLLFRPETGRGDITRAWPLLSSVVISFLIERLSRDSNKKEKAREWLSFLENWRGTDTRMEVFDLFVRLLSIAKLNHSDVWRCPWYVICMYFLHNERTDFEPTASGIGSASDILKAAPKDLRSQATALYLWTRIFRSTTNHSAESVANFLAYCLPHFSVRRAVIDARDSHRGQRIHVRREDTLPFWAFLSSAVVEREPSREPTITLNLLRLNSILLSTLGVRLPDDKMTTPSLITCQLQPVYQALSEQGVSAKELEGMRPFFNDDKLRARIRPFVVETGSRSVSAPPSRR